MLMELAQDGQRIRDVLPGQYKSLNAVSMLRAAFVPDSSGYSPITSDPGLTLESFSPIVAALTQNEPDVWMNRLHELIGEWVGNRITIEELNKRINILDKGLKTAITTLRQNPSEDATAKNTELKRLRRLRDAVGLVRRVAIVHRDVIHESLKRPESAGLRANQPWKMRLFNENRDLDRDKELP